MKSNTPGERERIERLYNLHCDLSRIAASMHSRGFLVDAIKRQALAERLLREYETKEAELKLAVGIDGFRCTPNDMRSLIYKRHANDRVSRFNLPDPLDPTMWSDSGESISVDSKSLTLLLIDPDCPDELKSLIEIYWDAETVWKARSTFVMSTYVEQAIGLDGRLRAGWNSCGTDTGRWSCSQPNLMNLEQSLRQMYRAAPGSVLIHADYSQLELRVMAAVAEDRELQERLATGDVYTADAIDWFNLPPETTKKDLKPSARKAAKIIHLASQYAAGLDAIFMQCLAQERTIKYGTVNLLAQAFKKSYAGTVRYWHEEHERVLKTGYSESRILRRRRTYPAEPPITETANYPIQSTASDIANLAMIKLDNKLARYYPKAGIIVQLHDAFDVECPESCAVGVAELMQECMENTYIINGVENKFPVEIKTGVWWDEV